MLNKDSQNEVSKTFWGSILSGLLGALGGAERSSKLFRRFFLPLMIAGEAYRVFHSWYVLSIFLMSAVFSIGYGIPDETDAGSPLGRFFYALFKHNKLLADLFTRGTIGCLISCTLAPITLIKQNYLPYIVGGCIITTVFALLSWRDLGGFEFRGKRLIYSEFIPYAIVGLVSFLLIYF
jgi:hypothetical protein